MSKNSSKAAAKLNVKKETVRRLDPISNDRLAGVAGGLLSEPKDPPPGRTTR